MEHRAMSFRIILDRQSEELIQRMLNSGRYDSPSAVVLDALQMLEDEEVAREARRATILASIDEAIADMEAGRGIPAEQVFKEAREIIRRAQAKRDAAE